MTKLQMSDADTLAFAVNRAYEVNTQVYETVYEDVSLAGLIPINNSYDEWSVGYGQVIGTQTGKARWQSTYAKDVPLADVGTDMVTAAFDEYAIGYQWNLGEIQKAARYGFALDTRRAAAARRGADEFRFDIAMIGSAEKGWTGLINNAAVTPVAAGSAWVSNAGVGIATPEAIVADLNSLVVGPASVAGTPGSLLSNRIALPALAYRHIATTPFGVTSPNETILSYFLKQNLYTLRTGQPVEVVEIPQLATVATVGINGGGRAIAWRNEANVLELPEPMPFRFLPLYQDGVFNYVVPGLARVGELDLRLPGAVRYLDGVTQVPA